MAYAIAQRRCEIGIRMALGAQRSDVVGMVVRETMMLVGAGLAIGVPAAFGAGRFVGSLLVGLKPTDPATLAAITLLMVAIGLVAGYVPGRRASRTSPVEALRQ
jgi:ABC-type antimicrobial peptide transport system permease subunit